MVPGKYAVQHKKNVSTSADYFQMTTDVHSVQACFYYLLTEIIYYAINIEKISALAILTQVHNLNLLSLWHEND
jgi:hypothetical protein